MNTSVERYITAVTEIKQLQTKIKELKNEISELEQPIKEYMESIQADAVTFKGVSVVLYSRTVKKRPNKTEIKEIMEKKIGNERTSELLTTISKPISETTEDRLRVVKKR